jgi:alkanesulfonate monooxygenase SsuD/methylene tetrahydromethanopterin reductase-like flavin-dependent oxidoreductase (luciferase family)
VSGPPIPVGVRLPLATETLTPDQMLKVCRAALELGYSSFWVGDHVLLPSTSKSAYPHTDDGRPGFGPDTPWLDPLLQLTWLAAQLGDQVRVGTSIILVTLRQPAVLAKQLSTVSWLTRRSVSLGVGSGWLRDEYDALGVPFEGRATLARQQLSEIRELLDNGRRDYIVRGDDDTPTLKSFEMRPIAPTRIEFLWGGFSPAAMRLIASSCDGWLPAKQSLEALPGHILRLRKACDAAGRNFEDLQLVVKPGSGPDPESGRISSASLEKYAELGFSEAILEMPYLARDASDSIAVLERVADRSWT